MAKGLKRKVGKMKTSHLYTTSTKILFIREGGGGGGGALESGEAAGVSKGCEKY